MHSYQQLLAPLWIGMYFLYQILMVLNFQFDLGANYFWFLEFLSFSLSFSTIEYFDFLDLSKSNFFFCLFFRLALFCLPLKYVFVELKNQKTFFCNTAILHHFFPSYFKVGKIIKFNWRFSINFELKNFYLKSWCIFALKGLSINLNLSLESLNFLSPFLNNFIIFRLNFHYDDVHFSQKIPSMKGNFIDKTALAPQLDHHFFSSVYRLIHYFRTFHAI